MGRSRYSCIFGQGIFGLFKFGHLVPDQATPLNLTGTTDAVEVVAESEAVEAKEHG